MPCYMAELNAFASDKLKMSVNILRQAKTCFSIMYASIPSVRNGAQGAPHVDFACHLEQARANMDNILSCVVNEPG